MMQLKKAITSSLGQKFLMALSGIGLIGFVVLHLLGNLALYKSDGTAFNLYAHSLESYESLLVLAELGLLAVFILHIVTAILLKKGNKAARPVGYKNWKSKGVRPGEVNPSNLSSRTMIISGLTLLFFLIVHIRQFKFGPNIAEGYVTQIGGQQIWDLHRVVAEAFSNPINVVFYLVAMVFLGLHLRHGFWSAFQSAGINKKETTRQIQLLGILLTVILSVGFFFIPIWMYFGLSRGGAQ